MKMLIPFSFLFLLSLSSAAQDITTGLVAYYPLNGDASDQSTYSNSGTVNGAIPTTDRFGVADGAMYFDGVNDHILIENASQINFGTGPLAVSLWVKADQPQVDPQMLVHKGESGPGAPQFWLRLNDFSGPTRLSFTFTEGVPPATALNTNIGFLDDENWHHVVVQRSAEQLQIWIDCKLVAVSDDDSNRDVTGEGELILGAQNKFFNGTIPNIHNFFEGSLDEIRFYNRTLTPDEILAVSNTYCPDEYVIDNTTQFCLYRASSDLLTSGPVIISENTVFKAGNSITIRPGFQTTPDIEFLAKIEDCSISEPSQPESFSIPDFLPLQDLTFDTKVIPNPFESTFRFDFLMEESLSAHLWIFDGVGRPVKTIFSNRLLDKGLQTENVDISDFPAGIYYLKFWTAEKSVTKKLIKTQ